VKQVLGAILEGPLEEFHQDTSNLTWQDEEISVLEKVYSIQFVGFVLVF